MNIYVRIDKVYGNTVLYPVCDKAKTFAKLAGTKTLASETVKHITALGFRVMQEPIPMPM